MFSDGILALGPNIHDLGFGMVTLISPFTHNETDNEHPDRDLDWRRRFQHELPG